MVGDRLGAEELSDLSVEALIELCEQHAVRAACEELDRRGVEPPLIEAEPPPIPPTDLSKVETAVRALGPQLAGINDELDRLRGDLSKLPFIGKS